MAKRDYDYLFKLVLIGDSGVGKSCLLLRFAVSIPNEDCRGRSTLSPQSRNELTITLVMRFPQSDAG